jgi:hypothetical protein
MAKIIENPHEGTACTLELFSVHALLSEVPQTQVAAGHDVTVYPGIINEVFSDYWVPAIGALSADAKAAGLATAAAASAMFLSGALQRVEAATAGRVEGEPMRSGPIRRIGTAALALGAGYLGYKQGVEWSLFTDAAVSIGITTVFGAYAYNKQRRYP